MQQDGGEVRGVWSMSYVEAVRHAYFVEHGVEADQDIARLVGVSKGAVSQHLAKPVGAMKGESLANVLRPIRLPELRNEVVVAWARELMGAGTPDVSDPNADWLSQVRALIVRDRPDLALVVSRRAFDGAADGKDRLAAFIQAAICSFRLDLPGETMELCGRLREWGERDGIPELVAAAHAAGSRAMRRTTLFTPALVADERDRARAVLDRIAAGGRPATDEVATVAARFAGATVRSEWIHGVLRVHESTGGEEESLRRILATAHAEREASARNGAGRARAAQLAARVLLALGKPDEAERYVRAAAEEGAREPAVRMEGEHLLGRLLAEGGRVDEALALLREAARECARRRFTYLGRVVESDITRLELTRSRGSGAAGRG